MFKKISKFKLEQKNDVKRKNPYITNTNELQNFLVSSCFSGEKLIHFTTSFRVTPDELLAIICNKRLIPYQIGASCEVISETSKITRTRFYSVVIEVTSSQGFELFLSAINQTAYNRLNKENKDILDKIYSIVNKVTTNNMTSFEKAKAVHDYLIINSEYDYFNYRNNSIPEASYTPYGLLFNHRAVCQAYAETFMIFMTIIGIECYVVVGNLISTEQFARENHAWNIIKIDDRYGHVDVTSDNPFPKTYGKPSDKFFFVSDEYLDRTHEWAINQYPLCK